LASRPESSSSGEARSSGKSGDKEAAEFSVGGVAESNSEGKASSALSLGLSGDDNSEEDAS
jgi:hypothetical protein